MDIKFKITLKIKNLISNSIKTFSKTITKRNIDIEYNIPIEIDNSVITSYFTTNLNKYCNLNEVNMDSIAVENYKIESKTENVSIYFENEDVRQYTLKPSIYAVHVATSNSFKLNCEQINDNSIKWYWDTPTENSSLIDDKNKIITNISNDTNYFIESNLTPNKTYTRRILTGEDKGLDCSLTLMPNGKTSIYTEFKEEDRDETLVLDDNLCSSRLKAFSSGIGDGLDCKIYKPYDTSYIKKFRLLNKIYGIRASNVVKHHTIKFKYRYKMSGIIDYPSYDGHVKVNVNVTPIDDNGSVIGSTITCTKQLEYRFDTEVQVADIYLEDILPELEKTYRVKYKIDFVLSEINGDLSIYSYTHGYRKSIFSNENVVFSEKGYYDHKINISSTMVIKQMEYTEFYPPKEYESLVNVVNGDFEVTPNGKKDYTENAHVFAPPPSVYNKKYYCIIEEISPSSSYVKYKFSGESIDKTYTEINGDRIVFSSDAIIENDTEYKDFIAQVEEGEYYIDDNRKHVYKYSLTDLTVNVDKYKRFELEVVASSNDVSILEHTTEIIVDEDNKINTEVSVTLRAVNNAIAKWEPLIHSGYYYYNQEERYLYTKSVVNGEDRILEDVHSKYQVAAKILVEATEDSGPIENYNLSKTTKDELWLDRRLYFWYQNRIWPCPISSSGKYYDFLEEYVYETEPFLFANKPTSIGNISWDQVCEPNNTIEVYAITYNEIYGQWNEPVKLTHGGSVPPELKFSKILKLRYIMKPSRLPDLVTKELLFSCENEWANYSDRYLSQNIYYKKEHLSGKSKKSDGIYVSKVFDLGDTKLTLKERSVTPNLKTDGLVEIYVQDADSRIELESTLNNTTWVKIEQNVSHKNLKRFFRFKIIIKPNTKIHYMNLILTRYEYNDDYSSFIPSIGNIRISAQYNPNLSTSFYEQIVVMLLPFDAKPHVIISNLKTFINQMAISQSFNFNNIINHSVSTYGEMKDDIEIGYNQSSITSEPIYITSKYVNYDIELIEKNQNGVIFNIIDNYLETSPMPQQYAPIIIIEENEFSLSGGHEQEPLTNVFFINEDTGEFSLYNTETFESLGFKTLYLQYSDIDEASVIISINGAVTNDYVVIDNIVKFNEPISKGLMIKVKYMLKNSYSVNYDYLNDKAIIRFNKYNGSKVDRIRIFYEVEKDTSLRKLDDINLNPLYNAAYNGYIYLCDYSLEPHELKIYTSSNFIHANGKDETAVILVVKDKNGNPVENIPINISCAFGTLIKENDLTDCNGIIKCTYTSSMVECIDVIKATATDKVKCESYIINRKV